MIPIFKSVVFSSVLILTHFIKNILITCSIPETRSNLAFNDNECSDNTFEFSTECINLTNSKNDGICWIKSEFIKTKQTISFNFNTAISNQIYQNESIKVTEEFNLNPKESICRPSSNVSILFIVFVLTAPYHFEKRNLIRKTWGNKYISSDFRIIFTIGMSHNETCNKKVENEYKANNDIIRISNFTDSYYELTTKVMKTHKWIFEHCNNAKYIMKIDDDVIVNTHNLIRHFRSLSLQKNTIFGYGKFSNRPTRNKANKFFVSMEIYSKNKYDDYVDGSVYILTADLPQRIYQEWLTFKYPPFSVRMEDVYLGMLAKRFNTTVKDYTSYFLLKIPPWIMRNLSFTNKAHLLLNSNIKNVLFLYEANYFKYFWNIFTKNGLNF